LGAPIDRQLEGLAAVNGEGGRLSGLYLSDELADGGHRPQAYQTWATRRRRTL
jgi:hypothetical protein